MKRPVISLVALLLFSGTAGLAMADDDRDSRRWERAERRYERESRRVERWIERGERRERREAQRWSGSRRFEDGPRYDPAPSQWRRGGVLPPGSRGARLHAYDRHRLRAPPPGFVWYQVGDDYLLTESVTGRIYEVVPGY